MLVKEGPVFVQSGKLTACIGGKHRTGFSRTACCERVTLSYVLGDCPHLCIRRSSLGSFLKQQAHVYSML